MGKQQKNEKMKIDAVEVAKVKKKNVGLMLGIYDHRTLPVCDRLLQCA